MKHVLLALVILTQLDGSPIRVDSEQIIIIKGKSLGCPHGTGAVVQVAGTPLCVRETDKQICNLIKRCD